MVLVEGIARLQVMKTSFAIRTGVGSKTTFENVRFVPRFEYLSTYRGE